MNLKVILIMAVLLIGTMKAFSKARPHKKIARVGNMTSAIPVERGYFNMKFNANSTPTTTFMATTSLLSIPSQPITFDKAFCSVYPVICRNAGLLDATRTS